MDQVAPEGKERGMWVTTRWELVCRRYEGDQMLGPFFSQCIGSGSQAAEMSSMENAPRHAIRCLGKYS